MRPPCWENLLPFALFLFSKHRKGFLLFFWCIVSFWLTEIVIPGWCSRLVPHILHIRIAMVEDVSKYCMPLLGPFHYKWACSTFPSELRLCALEVFPVAFMFSLLPPAICKDISAKIETCFCGVTNFHPSSASTRHLDLGWESVQNNVLNELKSHLKPCFQLNEFYSI